MYSVTQTNETGKERSGQFDATDAKVHAWAARDLWLEDVENASDACADIRRDHCGRVSTKTVCRVAAALAATAREKTGERALYPVKALTKQLGITRQSVRMAKRFLRLVGMLEVIEVGTRTTGKQPNQAQVVNLGYSRDAATQPWRQAVRKPPAPKPKKKRKKRTDGKSESPADALHPLAPLGARAFTSPTSSLTTEQLREKYALAHELKACIDHFARCGIKWIVKMLLKMPAIRTLADMHALLDAGAEARGWSGRPQTRPKNVYAYLTTIFKHAYAEYVRRITDPDETPTTPTTLNKPHPATTTGGQPMPITHNGPQSCHRGCTAGFWDVSGTTAVTPCDCLRLRKQQAGIDVALLPTHGCDACDGGFIAQDTTAVALTDTAARCATGYRWVVCHTCLTKPTQLEDLPDPRARQLADC